MRVPGMALLRDGGCCNARPRVRRNLTVDQVTGFSTAVAAERLHRVTRVAALVGVADVGDMRLRAFHLDLERGNQRVFRLHDDVAGPALHPEADGELHLRSPAAMLAA
jgi:hypothetical protein